MKYLLLAASIAVSCSVHAGVGRLDRTIAQHKDFSLQNKFDASCHMNAGSATLIDPYWVITANHVSGAKSENYKNTVTCYSYEKDSKGIYKVTKKVSASSDPKNDYGEYEFTYSDKSIKEAFDFALVRLDTPITDIKPVQLATEKEFPNVKFGDLITGNVNGFGNYNGRNGGTSTVKYDPRGDYWVSDHRPDKDSEMMSDLHWEVIHGDSGSGITVEKDGELYLLGEIGLTINAHDTFENIITKADWIKTTMKQHSFSYYEDVVLADVRWSAYSPENSDDYQGYFSYWKAKNADFNLTQWTADGGLVAGMYGDAGEEYTVEMVIPKGKGVPVFDLYVEDKLVAVNVDVEHAKTDAVYLKVNAFILNDDIINIEWRPKGKGKVILDHLAIK